MLATTVLREHRRQLPPMAPLVMRVQLGTTAMRAQQRRHLVRLEHLAAQCALKLLSSVCRALLDHIVRLRACLSLQGFAMQASIALADQTLHDRKTMLMVISVRGGRTVRPVQWRPSSAQQACTQLKNSRQTALHAQLASTAQMVERQSAVLLAPIVLKARVLMCLLVRLERSVQQRS